MQERVQKGAVSPGEEKARLRTRALDVRAAAARRAPDAGERLARHALTLPAAGIVSAYLPMRSEIDPLPLARALLARGARLALPAIADGRMEFRLWQFGEPLSAGPFGTREPDGLEVVPDLVLVPLLAFTRDGDRLGYGGGYYDGWLAAHPDALSVGVAYAAQEMPALPVEPHDVPLHMILTELTRIEPGDDP